MLVRDYLVLFLRDLVTKFGIERCQKEINKVSV